MAFSNLPTRSTADANASADINVLMENIRILGGNGTSAPSTDIETLFTNSVSFTSQAGVPSSTPSALGQFNLDTTGNRLYVSTGTSSSADWDKQGVVWSDDETVTGGSGDVVVTLPGSWEGGLLLVAVSNTTGEYFDTSGHALYITTYGALTSGGYTSGHIEDLENTNLLSGTTKTVNRSGIPKSATSASFTLDNDTSNTVFTKWVIIA